MIPVANFNFSVQGVSANFVDTSLNVPTSWSWDFGDPTTGANNTSNLQFPTHSFSSNGTFTISLTSTNVDGSSTKTIDIIVGASGQLMAISNLVDMKLPAGLTIDPSLKDTYIKTEQLYLLPLLTPAIDESNVYNEGSWPPLANMLVAELVVYKIVADQVQNLILALSNSSSNTTSTTQSALKKIVTGPSQAEWYNATEATTNFLSSTFKQGSYFDKMGLETICSLARRLNISHPLCKFVKKLPNLPRINTLT